jgi:hypothetical protein
MPRKITKEHPTKIVKKLKAEVLTSRKGGTQRWVPSRPP